MDYKLEDIINLKLLQKLQDKLNKIYSFPSAIIDNDGKILTAVAWQDICTKFHRQNPKCEKECIKSDQYILDHLHEANPAVSYQCPHGLVDNAAPIIINGKHYGNFFTGQFFLEKPDLEFFRKQAKVYNFDEKEYIKAVKKVPIWTKDKLNLYLDFIKEFIEIIVDIGLKNLKEIETNKTLSENLARNQSILKTAIDGFWVTNNKGELVEVNDAYCKMSGYSNEELLAMRVSDLDVNDSEAKVIRRINKIKEEGFDRFETIHRKKDGTTFSVEINIKYHAINKEQFIVFIQDINDRKINEDKLRSLTKRHQLATKSANIGIWDLNLKSNALIWDEQMFDLYGINPEDFGGAYEAWKAGVHPDDIIRSDLEVQEAIAGKKEFHTQFRVVWPNGQIRFIEAHAMIIKDSNGIPESMIGVNWDITERIKAEQELIKSKEKVEESEEKYRMLIENSIQGVVIAQSDPVRLSFASSAMENISGFTVSELTSMNSENIAKLIHSDDRQRFFSNFQKRLNGDNIESKTEYKIIDKSGTIKWVLVFSNYIKYKNENAVIATFLDITKQKQAAEELKEAEFQLNAIIENSPTGFAINRISNGEVTYVNKAFANAYHIPIELCSKVSTFFEYVYGDQMDLGKKILEDVKSKDPERMKWTFIPVTDKKTKKIHYVNASNILLKDLDIMISTVTDITSLVENEIELKKSKEKAEESDRLKSAFLANMSHEIRTPMNGILGFTDLLSEVDFSGNEKDNYIKIIQNSGNRLLNTVNDIIDISKIEAGQMEVNTSEININELTEQLYTFFDFQTKKKGLELILNTPAQSQNIILNSDSDKINAIFNNLINNAIKFTPSGKVEFGYQKINGEIQFFVKDTGIGISKKGIEVIFDRFRRVSNEEGFFSEGGSGLGLSITKAYVDMLGGKIWVESKKGEGTQFYFTIPFEAADDNESSSKEVDSDAKGQTKLEVSGLKILIAEDDESSVEFLKVIIEKISSEIIHALSGKEAVEQMKNHSDIDLVLMDINMPGMNGYEATKEIRKFNKDVIIIAQTAYALAGDREKSIEAGCDDYIRKPLNKKELLEKIENCLIKK